MKSIIYEFPARETIDGAGVRLKRVFGGSRLDLTDPFLLLDNFGSNKIEEYISGFPWHPHRGIQTVTYLLEGKIEHEDSEGNRGVIYPRDLQWMTAGSGIFHQEMPKPLDEKDPAELLKSTGFPTSVVGMQLWLNIPAKDKMTKPSYRGIKGSTTPVSDNGNGSKVKIISGIYEGIEGSFVPGGRLDPTYLDVSMEPESEFKMDLKLGYTTIIYVIAGSVDILSANNSRKEMHPSTAYVLSREETVLKLETTSTHARFILLNGSPLNEPVSWYGPIVMNNQEQINQAILDLRNNNFVRDKNPNFL